MVETHENVAFLSTDGEQVLPSIKEEAKRPTHSWPGYYGNAMEPNSHPHRLDTSCAHLRRVSQPRLQLQ